MAGKKRKLDIKIGKKSIRGKMVIVRQSSSGARYYLKRGKKVWLV